jgi:23S rRNA (adenine2503-C2)-methyltransferase
VGSDIVTRPARPPGRLVFDAPRRAKPPRHLADLDLAERRAAVVELGEPAYRADQLSRFYFGRLARVSWVIRS